MSIVVVCGVNWGDEGKGRVVDYLAQQADVVVRYQGGSNAGHTVVNHLGTFKLHLIPSGIFNPSVTNVLGPGMVIDLEALNDELAGLQAQGIACDNIKISDRAMISFPFHRDEDIWEEERLSGDAFGSTRRGIAPAYSDRHLKKGIQVGELLAPTSFRQRLRSLVEYKRLVAKGIYGKADAVQFQRLFDWATTHGDKVKSLICNTTEYLEEVAAAGSHIVFEAQLGALRDVYFGVYPFTSSSCTLSSFAPVGGGLFSKSPDVVCGVMKAFSTCVGAGPFVTEMEPAEADRLRETSLEYGAATGRPRRIGHFDALASRYGAAIQNATNIALTKLDSLSGRDELLICTHYVVDDLPVHTFPLNAVLNRARPEYIRLSGWREDISGVRRFSDLPSAAQRYVLKIEDLVRRPIRYVSVGPERDALIDRGAD